MKSLFMQIQCSIHIKWSYALRAITDQWSLTSSMEHEMHHDRAQIKRMTFMKWRNCILLLDASVNLYIYMWWQRVFSIGFLCQCLVESVMLTAASRSFHAKNVNAMLVYFKFSLEMSIMSFSLQSDSSFDYVYDAPILCCTLSMFISSHTR